MRDYEDISFEEWRRIMYRQLAEEDRLERRRFLTASTPALGTVIDRGEARLERDREEIHRREEEYIRSHGHPSHVSITPEQYTQLMEEMDFESSDDYEIVGTATQEMESESLERAYVPFSIRHKETIEQSKINKLVKRGYMKP